LRLVADGAAAVQPSLTRSSGEGKTIGGFDLGSGFVEARRLVAAGGADSTSLAKRRAP